MTGLGKLRIKIIRTEDKSQKLLPDDIPSTSRAAGPKTADKNEGSRQAIYSEISNSSRFYKFKGLGRTDYKMATERNSLGVPNAIVR